MAPPSTRSLARAAAAVYAANCALGTAVQLGVVDTSRNRRPHHVLYIVTSALTVATVLAGLARRSAPGVVLVPALLPLAVLPYVGHSAHAATAGAAAPWFLASLVLRGA